MLKFEILTISITMLELMAYREFSLFLFKMGELFVHFFSKLLIVFYLYTFDINKNNTNLVLNCKFGNFFIIEQFSKDGVTL